MYKCAKRAFIILIIMIATSLHCVAPTQAADASQTVQAQLKASQPSRATQNREDVARFYELRDFQPAWNSQNAAFALTFLKSAGQEGLDPAAYRIPKKAKGKSAASAWDIQMSAAVMRYARHLRAGRVKPSQIYNDVELPATDFDAADQLNTALKQGDLETFFRSLPPQRPEYYYLRNALANYRAAAKKPWGQMPALAGAIDTLPIETQQKLWTRLAAEDRKMGPVQDEPSVAALTAGLQRFQARHGLDADGILGTNTVSAMNVPAARRIAQIKANMERWRWLPHIPERRYIEVNVASADLKAVDTGRTVLTSAVVIGHRESKTPILATGIRSVVLNPAWPVPASMASNELYPKLLANGSYLQERDMILVNGPPDDPQGVNMNWRQVRRYPFPYLIQQQPGEQNALGAYLLDMRNRFDVYLHDTPSKELFSSAQRFFSHGCVRVERIAELANFVVTGDPQTDIPQHANLPRNKSERILIAPLFPVYFVYWTAFMSPDGGVVFQDDIYGRDPALIAALG
ncbi:MAG: L,D-transpeptidase family protein [Caulobacterales bacterium]